MNTNLEDDKTLNINKTISYSPVKLFSRPCLEILKLCFSKLPYSFRSVRKIAKIDCKLRHVRPSVHPPKITRLPMD
jgi:hypothetical protein